MSLVATTILVCTHSYTCTMASLRSWYSCSRKELNRILHEIHTTNAHLHMFGLRHCNHIIHFIYSLPLHTCLLDHFVFVHKQCDVFWGHCPIQWCRSWIHCFLVLLNTMFTQLKFELWSNRLMHWGFFLWSLLPHDQNWRWCRRRNVFARFFGIKSTSPLRLLKIYQRWSSLSEPHHDGNQS